LEVRNIHPKLQSLLSQEWVKYGLQTWPVHLEGPSEQKAIKIFGENVVWAYPGCVQFFSVPPVSQIISGMGKATNFKFCTHIHMIDRN